MALYGKTPSPQALREAIEIPNKKLLGLGWPIGRKSNSPFFNKSSSIDLIKSQVYQILRTKKGERPFLPEFGIDIEKYLFNPLDEIAVTGLVTDIRRTFARYASNIEIISLQVFQDENIKGYGMPGLVINLKVSPANINSLIDVEVVI